MTLHWWMHWFWITRPAAVVAQLIFLLAAVQTVPLPASTLDPHGQNSQHIQTQPDTSWASGNDLSVTNDRATSSYLEQRRQTAVYEGGPVWSSSPDIEEPFYPTTASNDNPSNRDLSTENIPNTQKTKPYQELSSETYQQSSDRKIRPEYGDPTEYLLQSYSQHVTHVEESTVQNANSLDTIRKKDLHNAGDKLLVNSISYLNQDIPILEEPHVLPLAMTPNVIPEEESFPSTPSDFVDNTPKKVQINLSSLQVNHDHLRLSESSSSYPQNGNISNSNDLLSFLQDRKYSSRLVIRDLSNKTQSTVLSNISSHENNSTNVENQTLINPSIRGSKAIESFPHSSAAGSSESKKEHVVSPNKEVEDDDSVQNPVNVMENKTVSKDGEVNSNVKLPINIEPAKVNHSVSNQNISFSSLQNNSRSHSFENGSDKVNNRKMYIESDSSKLVSSNASVPGININTSQSIPLSNRGESSSTVNVSFQNVTPNPATLSTTGLVFKESSSPETSVPFDISISHKITTLSDTEEVDSLTPVHNHEFIGRSASLSHDTETTMEPSIVPVSRSRVAVSPADMSHRTLDAASITGIALGIVVFAGLTGAVSFVLYRRRYLNKPQTLNDKCSNPDSSGYIDDSTLRENSEEMYSLDNDSFLNSLEAMTIQNYWTDNVKHTKL